MASAIHTTLHAEARRRDLASLPAVLTPELRAAIAREANSLLDAATFLLDCLNTADAPHADLEPDTEGEGAPDEGSAQPITLSSDRRLAVTHRPSRRAMRVAYRHNGDPISANPRGLLGRAFA